MRRSVLQKEGMPFKSLVIISTNGVHVFLYYNGEHINVCGESGKHWKKEKDYEILASWNRGCESDVWLTVHRNSVWLRKTN